MFRSALMTVMTEAARKASKGLIRDFGEVENLQVSMKGPGDFVTAADRRAERLLVDQLSKARPGYGFLNEEGGEIIGSDQSHRWIIDPLDGTTNFLHGIPIFAISIGLERDGQLIAGLVYNPISDEMFHAEKGKGAYVNERRLRVANRRELETSVIGTGIPTLNRPDHPGFMKELSAVMRQTSGVRRLGAAALDLAYVAAGRLDAFWERGLNPWDMAAGILLVREAGGYVTDLTGGQDMFKTSDVVCGNEFMTRELRTLIANARKTG